MQVEVKKLSQDVNLETGATENFAIFHLPNGSVIRAKISEDAAQAITDCFVNGNAAKSWVNQDSEGLVENYGVDEFGGNTPSIVKPATQLVGVDESGNPIVRPLSTSGPRLEDDDGVGQV